MVLLPTALSAFDIAAVLAALGAVACRLAVVPRDATCVPARALQRFTGATLALLTVSSLGILLSRTLELNGSDWSTLPADARLALTATHFGHVWAWRVPALAIAWLAWLGARRQRRDWTTWLIALAIAAIALTRSETGHPADHGDFTLAVWIDWLHVLAAGAWVGSLFGMSWVVFPQLLRAGDTATAESARIFQRLSTWCGVALAVLVACGIYNASTQLDCLASLWRSRYGVTLLIKLSIVAVMVAIGAHNRYVKLPKLRAAAATATGDSTPIVIRACARAVLWETLLALAVIGATAALIHAMPPADMPAARGMDAMPTSAHVPSVALPSLRQVG